VRTGRSSGITLPRADKSLNLPVEANTAGSANRGNDHREAFIAGEGLNPYQSRELGNKIWATSH
jgi:hypothetical protein